MHIVFSHGKESGPWGSKIKRLADTATDLGHTMDSLNYTDTMDPDVRVARLINSLKKTKAELVLVGSSMGGYVSLVASQLVRVKGVFLLAPALYMPGYAEQSYTRTAPTEIVHGWGDDVIPPDNSIRFAREADCTLHLISGDHRLNSSLDEVESLFVRFLHSLAS